MKERTPGLLKESLWNRFHTACKEVALSQPKREDGPVLEFPFRSSDSKLVTSKGPA